MVYPGEENVMVNLTPEGETMCSDIMMAIDTHSTTYITGNCNYNISLTLSNDVGASQLVSAVFDSELSIPVSYYIHRQFFLTKPVIE